MTASLEVTEKKKYLPQVLHESAEFKVPSISSTHFENQSSP